MVCVNCSFLLASFERNKVRPKANKSATLFFFGHSAGQKETAMRHPGQFMNIMFERKAVYYLNLWQPDNQFLFFRSLLSFH